MSEKMTQAGLFDLDFARQRRDLKIAQAYAAAQVNVPDLIALAEKLLPEVAARHPELVGTDELLADNPELEAIPEKRALAHVLLSAAKAGIIERTDEMRVSRRPSCNARRKTVWRSLIYSGVSNE